MSSGVDGYEEDADLRNQQLLMLRQHSHSNVYHVPQHSRREKLRFQPPPSSLLLQDHSPVVLPNLTVSSSSSSSPSSYLSTNPNSSFSVAPALQFVGPARRFSLSLTSPSYSHLRPMLDHDPPQPFTGYAAVLNESRFLEATLQLLQGTCDVGRAAARDGGDGARCHTDCMVLLHHAMEDVADVGRTRNGGSIVGAEQVWKKTKLVSMLDEVYSRYTHYYQQVQSIVRAFESVTGLCTAAPYALMALRTMSKQFRCLANMISDQLHQMNKAFEGASQNEVPGSSNVTGGVCGVRTPINSSAYQNQPIWRPQRGLPERAVSVLRKWLFEHFLHPYPTDTDKQILAKQTGLSRNQVSNWFINARVRLWKPMVEEIHSLEMRQSHRVSTADRSHSSNEPRQLPPDAPAAYPGEQAVANDKPWKDHQSSPSEPFRDEITQIGNQIQEPAEFPSNVMPSNHDVGVETGPGRASGGVTLTLGLHQSNGLCLTEPLPLNTVHSFGLHYNDAYVMEAMEGHDQHFGRGMGGHLVHDFVG